MLTPPPVLFLAGAATAYFAVNAVHILRSPNPSSLQKSLGGILIFWALLNAKDILMGFPEIYTKEVAPYFVLFDGWSITSYFIFIFELTETSWATWKKGFYISLPFFIFWTIYAIWPCYEVYNIYIVFLWIAGVVFFIYAFIKMKKHERYILENYSNIDEIDISWLKYMFFFAFFEQTLYFVMSVKYNFLIELLYYISAIGMWNIAIYYTKNLRPITIIESPEPELEMIRNENRSYTFASNIEKLVENQELYLNKDLTLTDLAKKVGTNRTYLSDYFSNHKHTTFYDYINQLRIEQMAIPMIQQHPEYTLEFIATESGFKSISTFRRAFAKFKGMSPSQYRSELEAIINTKV